MRLFVHPDPVALEQELLRQIEAKHPAGTPGRTLVVVPSARLVAHLQGRLLERRPAWLGLDVRHFRALARDVLQASSAAAFRIASPRLLQALLWSVLERETNNLWSRFSRRRPRILGRLFSAVRLLREAGITPEELLACHESRTERDWARIFRAYCQSLEERAAQGWVDDAGMVAAALPSAGQYAKRYRTVFLHGAYELIGIYLELFRALDATTPLRALLPIRPGARVSTYAEGFARRHLLDQGGRLEPIEAGESERDWIACLYDEQAEARTAEEDRIRFHHAQGAGAEVRIAARRALHSVADGCPPEEIVIVGRSLDCYTAGFEEVLEAEDFAWTSSLAAPLRRQPLVHDFLLLLRVVTDGFPRRGAAELLRSPRVRWAELIPGSTPFDGDLADLWSRRARIIGGLAEWDAVAAPMGRALAALETALAPGRVRGWNDHAKLLQRCLEWLQVEPDDAVAQAALAALRQILEEMGRIPELTGERRTIPFGEMVTWLEEALDGAALPLRREDEGGVRVLDAMQLRGLTCRRLHLIGLNGGVFPRIAPMDPVLGDGLRERLRHHTGRPLPLRSESADEERLLLSLILGAASERVEVSWQRADESGRTQTPSLALRELARVTRGRPDAAAAVEAADHWPVHPLDWLETMERQTGMLAPGEEMLLTALRAGGPGSPTLLRRFPALGPGLRMLRATESHTPGDAAYDGGTGGAAESPERFSVTGLETLGRCPLRYFFRHVLRVRELEAEAVVQEIAPWEMGSEIHELLERLYGELAREKLFAQGSKALAGAALERLEAAWNRAVGKAGARTAARLPLLWERTRDRWLAALRAFLAEDLRRISDGGWRPAALEETVERDVDLGKGIVIRLAGRFDRRLEREDGARIGDYKSSGSLERRGNESEMLKAGTLQVPLYWLVAGGEDGVELLGVGPDYDYETEAAEKAGRRVAFDGFDDAARRDGFLETVRVLVELVRRGRFPLHQDDRLCPRCPYDQACRRTHPPTVERERNARETRDYYRLSKKNKSKLPSLKAVIEEKESGRTGS